MVVYLLVKKRRTKSWNWPHVMICPPDPVHPSLPDLVPCALETWLLWTTVTGSLALWVLNGVGCERDGKAFYRQERNEFGCLFSWLPLVESLHPSARSGHLCLRWVTTFLPDILENRLAVASGYCRLGDAVLYLVGPGLTQTFVKSLELLRSYYPTWVCASFSCGYPS